MYNTKREDLLIIVDSNTDIREIDLASFKKNKISFGRDSDNDIILKSAFVGRRPHGIFERFNGDWYVYDNKSTNGIIVNNKPYRTAQNGEAQTRKLRDGDIIRVDSISKDADHSLGTMMLYRTRRSSGMWKKFPVAQQAELTIGRSSSCDVVLESVNVSRRHASISFDGKRFILKDLNSSNGVFLNGERVLDSSVLCEKDIITVAGTTIFFTNNSLVYKTGMDGTRVSMRNISRAVTVKGQKRMILQDVNLTVEPNEFIAVIGGSGAGKSTVMNAMSGFEQATSGNVYVNGIDLYKNYRILKNMIGYVPQSDIIYENITLQKMLEYSARMRMPEDISPGERQKRINEVLKMVELEEHKDKFIRSLSGGQRKRASIAVELLADPGLFFLDEPTSGLDPGTEESLMKTLNRLSKQKGKTVIMVTHTTQNLHLCDKILFMGKGGIVCFYGSPKECLSFFGADNLTEIYNKVLTDEEVAFWSQKYKNDFSDVKSQNGGTEKNIEKTKKASFVKQFSILSSRYMTLIKNDIQRLIMIFLQPVIIAILLALVATEDVFEVYGGTKSIMFALSCAGIWMGLFNSIQEICKERSILKREYMANLRLGSYVMSKFFVQLLLSIMQSVILVGIFVLSIGKPSSGLIFDNPIAEIFITMALTIFSSAAIGLVISSVFNNSDKAMTAAPFVLIVQLLFSGILFDLSGITEKISYLTVSRWSVSALGTTSNLNALPTQLAAQAIQREAESVYEYAASNIAHSWLILFVFIVICAVLCNILLRRVSKDSR